VTLEQPLVQPKAVATSAPAEARFRPLSLRLNFAWTLVGNAVYGGAQWGMLILLAKLGSREMLGRFALGLAVAAPVVMFTNMQLRLVQATDARHEFSFRDYLSLRLLASGAAFLVVAGAAMLSHRAEVVAVILLVGAAKCVESVSDVIWGLWQKCERLDLISISMMIKGPVSLLAMWLILSHTKSLILTTASLAVVWTGLLLTYDVSFARRLLRLQRLAPRLVWAARLVLLRRLAWLALPLGVVGLLDSLNLNVPRYFIERHLGDASLGYFAALASIMVVGNMVVGALAQSASARLSRLFVTDKEGFLRLIWRLVAFGAALGAAGLLMAMLLGRQVLARLYQADYGTQAGVLVWVMVGAGLGYIGRFLIVGTSAARSFRAQAPLYVISLLVAGVGSWRLVPRWGLLGAAWALSASLATMLIGAALILWCALRHGPSTEPSASRLGAADGA